MLPFKSYQHCSLKEIEVCLGKGRGPRGRSESGVGDESHLLCGNWEDLQEGCHEHEVVIKDWCVWLLKKSTFPNWQWHAIPGHFICSGLYWRGHGSTDVLLWLTIHDGFIYQILSSVNQPIFWSVKCEEIEKKKSQSPCDTLKCLIVFGQTVQT